MYQLTCPSCKTPQKTPFVRMGAVAMCGSCGHKYPVKTEYFVKLPPESPASPEMVDRLLGIVPISPGATGMAMNAANTSSGVIMPNVPPSPPVPPSAPAAAGKPAPKAGTQAGAQTVAAQATQPTQAGNSTSTTPAQPASRPAAQPAAAAKPSAAPTPAPAVQEAPKPEEPQESTGFFGKLFKRFK